MIYIQTSVIMVHHISDKATSALPARVDQSQRYKHSQHRNSTKLSKVNASFKSDN